MKNEKNGLSVCIPIYNEEKIILKNIKILLKGLSTLFNKKDYEIILIDNGSTDNTLQLVKKIRNVKIKVFHLPFRGYGAASREAIKHAKYPYIQLSAIDLPFLFSDLEAARKHWSDYDIIYGSKAHPKSKVYVSTKRKLTSFVYRSLLKILFQIKIKDPQGSVFFKKKSVSQILQYCTANDAFFTAQLAIYGTFKNLSMSEVPVKMNKNYLTRKSKYNIFLDGQKMLFSIFHDFLRIRRIRQEHVS